MTYLLNLLDLAFTLYALSLGFKELNPLLQSIPVLLLYKVVIVGGLCWWLSRRPEIIAKVGLQLCTGVYGLLCVYHIYNFTHLIEMG